MTDDDGPEIHARRSDPNTSHDAAKNIPLGDKSIVKELFLEWDPIPLTDDEVGEQLGGDRNGKWRKRRSDLTNEGFLIAVGEVFNPKTRQWVKRWAVNRGQLQPPPSPQLKLI